MIRCGRKAPKLSGSTALNTDARPPDKTYKEHHPGAASGMLFAVRLTGLYRAPDDPAAEQLPGFCQKACRE